MPLFLYKRRKKKKKTKYLQVDTVECELSHSLHCRRMCVHVLVCWALLAEISLGCEQGGSQKKLKVRCALTVGKNGISGQY